jgi:hypothetical protein
VIGLAILTPAIMVSHDVAGWILGLTVGVGVEVLTMLTPLQPPLHVTTSTGDPRRRRRFSASGIGPSPLVRPRKAATRRDANTGGAERVTRSYKCHASELELGGVEPSFGGETRIGGPKYLVRLGLLPAKGERPDRWKADFRDLPGTSQA